MSSSDIQLAQFIYANRDVSRAIMGATFSGSVALGANVVNNSTPVTINNVLPGKYVITLQIVTSSSTSSTIVHVQPSFGNVAFPVTGTGAGTLQSFGVYTPISGQVGPIITNVGISTVTVNTTNNTIILQAADDDTFTVKFTALCPVINTCFFSVSVSLVPVL